MIARRAEERAVIGTTILSSLRRLGRISIGSARFAHFNINVTSVASKLGQL